MEANFVKVPGGHLVPASDADKELIDKIKTGQVLKFKFSRMRNYQFFRKWWALINFAFDYWEPPEISADSESKWMKHVTPEKNIDRFRKDVTILAGYHEAYYRVDGSVRIEAKSIAFGNMKEDEFEKLYSATIDVVLKHICVQYTEDQLNSMVDQTLAFV